MSYSGAKSINSRVHKDCLRDGAFQKYIGYGIYHGKESEPPKKFKGFPMFLYLKIFKTALMGDIRQWWCRH
jgi:hypothetical protein